MRGKADDSAFWENTEVAFLCLEGTGRGVQIKNYLNNQMANMYTGIGVVELHLYICKIPFTVCAFKRNRKCWRNY